MPFPNLNLTDLPAEAHRYTTLLSMAGVTSSWQVFLAELQFLPTTSAIAIVWAYDWNIGGEVDIAQCRMEPRMQERFGGITGIGTNYIIGPNAQDLGAIVDQYGNPTGRRLRATDAGNCYLVMNPVPVIPNLLHRFSIQARRNAGTVTGGSMLRIDEFAGFSAKEDSKYFDEKLVDPAIRKEIEGGFVSTRRRFTRSVREITTGFTDISEENKQRFFDYVETVGGGSASFPYIHPVTGESLTVRFKDTPSAKYAGMGGNHRWDIANIKLETV